MKKYLWLLVLVCLNVRAHNYSSAITDANENRKVIIDTASKKEIETKISANIFETNIPKLSGWLSLAQQIGFQNYYLLLLPKLTSNNDVAEIKSFTRACNASIGVYYSLRSGNFPQDIDWLVNTFDPEFIELDQESQNKIDNDVYVSKAHEVIAHVPGRICSLDAALVYKNNRVSIERNESLAGITSTIYARQYAQIHPDICNFTSNQDSDLILIDNYFENLLPQYLNLFLTRLPHLTKEVVLQWHNEDAKPEEKLMSDKPLGNYAIGEMARFVLSNTDHFAYLTWMTLGNLISRENTPEPEYISIKRIAPLFKYKFSMPLSLPFAGVAGRAFRDTSGNWALLIDNKTSESYTILQDDIKGVIVSGNFHRDSGWAESWNSIQNNEIAIEPTITIKPNSVNVVTFKGNN